MQPNIINAGLCSAVSAAVVVSLSGLMPVTAHAAPPGQPADRLVGKTIFLDPGHQGPNHSENLSRQVDNGRGGTKDCQTTGMTSLHGIPEHTINWEVAQLVKASLQALGAEVVLSRDDDSGWGGCVDDRARAANASGAQIAVSIHADSAPADLSGFHLIVPELPIPDTAAEHAQSGAGRAASAAIRDAYRAAGFASATYAGVQEGLQTRADIAGPALTHIPLVFVEMGNGANAEDAALLESRDGQLKHAVAIATGVVGFLMNAPVAGTTPVVEPDRTAGSEETTAPDSSSNGTESTDGAAPTESADSGAAPTEPTTASPEGTGPAGASTDSTGPAAPPAAESNGSAAPDQPHGAPAQGADPAPSDPAGAPVQGTDPASPDSAGAPAQGTDPASPDSAGAPAHGTDPASPDPAGAPAPEHPAAPLTADQGASPSDQGAPSGTPSVDSAPAADPAPAPADAPAPAEEPVPADPAAAPVSLFAAVRHPVADPPKPPTGSSGHLSIPGEKKPDPATNGPSPVAPKPPTGSTGGLTIPGDNAAPPAAPDGTREAVPSNTPDSAPNPMTTSVPSATPDAAPGPRGVPAQGLGAVPVPTPGAGRSAVPDAVTTPGAAPAPAQGLGLVPVPGADVVPTAPPAGLDSVPGAGAVPADSGSVPAAPRSAPSTGAARTTTSVPSAPPAPATTADPAPANSEPAAPPHAPVPPKQTSPATPVGPIPARAPIGDPVPVRTAPPGAPSAPAPTPRERGTTPKSQATPEESLPDVSSLSSSLGGPVMTIMNLLMPMAQALGMDNSAATSQLINLAYTLAGVVFGPTK
ncbi:N-acetylmuramoyl-L-alanine amidase [Nocardia sp. NPDC004415]